MIKTLILFFPQGERTNHGQEEGYPEVHLRVQVRAGGVEGPGAGENGGGEPEDSAILQTPGAAGKRSHGEQETEGGGHGSRPARGEFTGLLIS